MDSYDTHAGNSSRAERGPMRLPMTVEDANLADMLRRRLRYASPVEVRRRVRYMLQRIGARRVRPIHVSVAENVYHCCVQRTGSQWIRYLLADPRVSKYSGLTQGHPRDYIAQQLEGRSLLLGQADAEFPSGVIVSPLYADYPAYLNIRKPRQHRAFFVMRDPRDIVVSWYFSARYSHGARPGTPLAEIRRELDSMSLTQGLLFSIRRKESNGLFDALRSWSDDAASKDPNILVVRYEDLIGPKQRQFVTNLFEHCDIRMPGDVITDLLHEHSFERMSGRNRGDENKFSHFRKGVAGDWTNYFDVDVAAEFSRATRDLVVELGYERT